MDKYTPTEDKMEKEVRLFKKREIKKLIKTHFRYHNRLNLTEHLANHTNLKYKGNNGVAKDMADKMNESGLFTREVVGADEYWVVKNVMKGWAERNPGWDKIRTGFITALFSLIVGIALFQINNQGQARIDNKQNESLLRTSDSLTILDKKIKAFVLSLISENFSYGLFFHTFYAWTNHPPKTTTYTLWLLLPPKEILY
jgi:hypothetical protein